MFQSNALLSCVIIGIFYGKSFGNPWLAVEKIEIGRFEKKIADYTTLEMFFEPFADAARIGSDICAIGANLSWYHHSRCLTSVSQTIRNGRMLRIREIVKDSVNEVISNGELYGLTYAMEFGSLEGKRLCVVGVLELPSLAMILTYLPLEVWFLSSSAESVEAVSSAHAYDITNVFNSSMVFVLGGKRFWTKIEVIANSCDVFWVSGLSATIFDEISKILLKILAAENKPLVWSQDISAAAAVDVEDESRVRWDVESSWVKYSTLVPKKSKIGFTSRSYKFADGFQDYLQQIKIGEVREAAQHCYHRQQLLSRDTLVIAITYTNIVFGDTAVGLHRALKRLGFYYSYLVTDLTVAAARFLRRKAEEIFPGNEVLQITLGPHEMGTLLPHYVAFQMEQLWSIMAFHSYAHERYSFVLRRALSIFTFSAVHKAHFESRGFEHVELVPIYSSTQYEADDALIIDSGGSAFSPKATHSGKYVDVLFFGSCSPRRGFILQPISDYFTERGAVVHVACGGWDVALLEEQRDMYVERSRVVLNVHLQRDSVLEVHRINYLLSMGACIVSERSADPALDALYADAVHFIDTIAVEDGSSEERDLPLAKEQMQELIALIDSLLSDYEALHDCNRRSLETYHRLHDDLDQLDTAMSSVLRRFSSLPCE